MDSPSVSLKRSLESLDVSKRQKTDKPYPSVRIQELSLKGDYVTIINTSVDTIDIGKWKIVSDVGDNQQYIFPESTVLPAGGSITLWSGRDADKKAHPPHSFFWTKKNMWYDFDWSIS